MLTEYTAKNFLNFLTGRMAGPFSNNHIFIGLTHEGVEISAPSYQRILVGSPGVKETYMMDDPEYNEVTERYEIKNGSHTISFDVATESWGQIDGFFLTLEQVAKPNENLLVVGSLTTPVTVSADEVAVFRKDQLLLSII